MRNNLDRECWQTADNCGWRRMLETELLNSQAGAWHLLPATSKVWLQILITTRLCRNGTYWDLQLIKRPPFRRLIMHYASEYKLFRWRGKGLEKSNLEMEADPWRQMSWSTQGYCGWCLRLPTSSSCAAQTNMTFCFNFPRPAIISLIEGKSRPSECDFEGWSNWEVACGNQVG